MSTSLVSTEGGGWGRQRVSEGGHLSPVQGLVGGVAVVEETHVDEVDEEARGVLGGEGVVRRPLVEDQQDQVAEQAGHEDDLRDEAQEDVQGLLEVPGATKQTFSGAAPPAANTEPRRSGSERVGLTGG